MHYLFLPFFCPANIYRPSLGKVQLDRPNPKLLKRWILVSTSTQFLSQTKKKYHSTQNCMHYNGTERNFQF